MAPGARGNLTCQLSGGLYSTIESTFPMPRSSSLLYSIDFKIFRRQAERQQRNSHCDTNPVPRFRCLLREIDHRARWLTKRLDIAEVVEPAAQTNRDRIYSAPPSGS